MDIDDAISETADKLFGQDPHVFGQHDVFWPVTRRHFQDRRFMGLASFVLRGHLIIGNLELAGQRFKRPPRQIGL